MKSSTNLFLRATLMLLLAAGSLLADTPLPEAGFVNLFDGKTLEGWKVGENADVFRVQDGMIVMECPPAKSGPAHLFYEGTVNGHTFKNFDLRVDVMTFPAANSGIYFHADYQAAGWPNRGLECQVNNSHSDWRRTGSLWGIRNISWGPETPAADNKEMVTLLPEPAVTDNVWFTPEIICRDGLVTVKLNGKTMFEYQVADANTEHALATGGTWLPQGTFALQGHPPMAGHISKVCFRNIRVKALPE